MARPPEHSATETSPSAPGLAGASGAGRRGASRFARLRRGARAPWLWFSAVALLLCVFYVTLDHPRRLTASPYAHGDGRYYYAYFRSLYFDQDLDFENDYELLGNPFRFGTNPVTGKRENVFPLGPALAWLPLAPVADAAVAVGNARGWLDEPTDGTGPFFQRTVVFGSVLAGLAAMALVLRLSLRFASPLTAFLGAMGVGLASPLLWFMYRQPSYSHAADAFATALFVVVWLEGFRSRSTRRWLTLGLSLGLAMLVRPQNAVNAVLPLGEWILLAVPLVRAREGAKLGKLVGQGFAFVLATMVAAAPVFLAWRSLYGEWVLVPHGPSFMLWGDSRWDAVLFSSRAGLFAWHPLLLLGALGLGLLAVGRRYAPELRFLGALGLVAFALHTYVNGAANDWWGGWAFGGRRFVGCTVYLGVGLAASLDASLRWLERHSVGVVRALPCVLVACFAFANRSLMEDYLVGRAKPGSAQAMKPLYQAAATKAIDDLYAVTGNPGSLPANLAFALRAHTSPERYDLASATDVPSGATARIDFATNAHAMGGFGEPTEHAGRTCRIASGRSATWVFALREDSHVAGMITLASLEAGARVRMRAGGRTFFDQTLSTDWREYPLELPSSIANTGLVYVEVEQLPATEGPWRGVAWEKATASVQRAR